MADELTVDVVVARCLEDARARLGPDADVDTVVAGDFPNSALGAARPGEISLQMITSGWTIRIVADGRSLEYRANPLQIRLVGYDGANFVIYPA